MYTQEYLNTHIYTHIYTPHLPKAKCNLHSCAEKFSHIYECTNTDICMHKYGIIYTYICVHTYPQICTR